MIEAEVVKKKLVQKTTLDYFNKDELATNVFLTKYALKNKEGDYVEKSPDDMHKRLAKEFARMEKKFKGPNQLSEKKIYDLLKGFKYIVPTGVSHDGNWKQLCERFFV